MSVVFQTAQNKSALETPSRAEELLNEHFNIRLLTDKENYTVPPNAQAQQTKASVDTRPHKHDPGDRTQGCGTQQFHTQSEITANRYCTPYFSI